MSSAAIREKKIPEKYRTYFHHLSLGTKTNCNNIANYNFSIISIDSLFLSHLYKKEKGCSAQQDSMWWTFYIHALKTEEKIGLTSRQNICKVPFGWQWFHSKRHHLYSPVSETFLLCSMCFTCNKDMRTDKRVCQFSPVCAHR